MISTVKPATSLIPGFTSSDHRRSSASIIIYHRTNWSLYHTHLYHCYFISIIISPAIATVSQLPWIAETPSLGGLFWPWFRTLRTGNFCLGILEPLDLNSGAFLVSLWQFQNKWPYVCASYGGSLSAINFCWNKVKHIIGLFFHWEIDYLPYLLPLYWWHSNPPAEVVSIVLILVCCTSTSCFALIA